MANGMARTRACGIKRSSNGRSVLWDILSQMPWDAGSIPVETRQLKRPAVQRYSLEAERAGRFKPKAVFNGISCGS